MVQVNILSHTTIQFCLILTVSKPTSSLFHFLFVFIIIESSSPVSDQITILAEPLLLSMLREHQPKFKYFIPHGNIHWLTGSNEMTELNILDCVMFLCGTYEQYTASADVYIFRTIIPLWIHRWLRNDGVSVMSRYSAGDRVRYYFVLS